MTQQAHIPKPKFGWSERIAHELEERMEKIEELRTTKEQWISPVEIPTLFEVPEIDDPPELEDDAVYRKNDMAEYTLSYLDSDYRNGGDIHKLMADHHPHSSWGEWAMAKMEAEGIKRCIPANHYDSEGTLVFGLTAV